MAADDAVGRELVMLDAIVQLQPQLQAGLPLLLGVVGTLLVVALVVRARHGRQRDTHGSSRWATLREARKGGLVRTQGYPLGLLGGTMLRSVGRHILQVGGTGSRKDRSYNFPFTVACPWSMVIVDVKNDQESQGMGESYYHCGAARMRRGPVYRICPGDPQSHAWNPLATVRVNTPHEFRDVMYLAHSLLAPQKKEVRASDSGQFFDRRGAVVLRGVLLYSLHTLKEPTLTACSRLMDDAESLLTAMHAHPHTEVQARGLDLQRLAEEGGRQFAAEWSTAKDVLDLFTDPAIEAISSRSDFALEALQHGTRPCTLYLGAESPLDLTYLYRYYRLLIECAYRVLARTSHGKRWDLTILLNEFDTLGWMDIVERAPAHARAARIWFVVVVQDLAQLFGHYGFDTPLWGNLRVKIAHATDNDETARRISDMLCDQTIEVWSDSYGRGRSRTRHNQGRKLLDVSEVMGLGAEHVIVWAGLDHPLRLTKPPYWKGL